MGRAPVRNRAPMERLEEMTSIDDRGRRYIEVRPFWTDVEDIRAALEACPEACVDCGAPIVHGATRYFQRHDPAATRRHARAHPLLSRTLDILTFDSVCGFCGDRALELEATT